MTISNSSVPSVETLVRTFEVLLSNQDRVDAALTALNKRAARKGLPLLAFSWGKAFSKPFTVNPRESDIVIPPLAVLGSDGNYHFDVPVIPLEIVGSRPKYNGWAFLATLEHLEGETIVRGIEGAAVPTIYRTRGSVCDHCRVSRRRNDTYVVQHEDGRTMQVGSSCMADFLGSDKAGNIAFYATLLSSAFSVCEDGEEGFGGTSESASRLLPEVLGWVAMLIREDGWVSRKTVREQGEGRATADDAWYLMTDTRTKGRRVAAGLSAKPSDEDVARGIAAAEWAENLSDETVNAESGDYLHNIRAIARTGVTTFRAVGLGGSIVAAYDRAMGKARKAAERAAATRDEYIGTVGEKVTFAGKIETKKNGEPKKGQPSILSSDPVTLDFVAGYESSYGYVSILKFRTAEGHTLVWKTSSSELAHKDVGRKYVLFGTIKAHTRYKGAKQTELTRCATHEVVSAPTEASQAA